MIQNATPDELAWMTHAACRGMSPTQFFPPDGPGVEEIQAVCATCPVTYQCLETALTHRIDHGVWGGTSERERQRILRRRNRTTSNPHR